jgi:hypothetical protein
VELRVGRVIYSDAGTWMRIRVLSYKFHLLSLLLQLKCDEQVYEHSVLIVDLSPKQSCYKTLVTGVYLLLC